MRNLSPAPHLSLLAVAVVFIALAVWPIGCAKAEATSHADHVTDKNSVDGDDVAFKSKRSLKYKDINFADQLSDHSLLESRDKPMYYYRKWNKASEFADDDAQYSSQSDLIGNVDSSYESDGYGYDDDEYDHFNYKRYDSDKDKIGQDTKVNKENAANVDKSSVMGAGKTNPEQDFGKTTIELLNFQAKNINPSEAFQSGVNGQPSKEESKLKTLNAKKTSFSKSSDGGKESMADDKLKKKTSSQAASQTSDSSKASSDKNAGAVGNSNSNSNKMAESRENSENKSEKDRAKVAEGQSSGPQINAQTLKATVQVAESKESGGENLGEGKTAKFDDLSKNEARITEKDAKESDAKLRPEAGKSAEEKDAASIKDEKDMEPSISEAKSGAESTKEDSRDKNLSQFVGGQANLVNNAYKERAEDMNEARIADECKGSEDMKDVDLEMAGFRDSRSDLPYGFRDANQEEADSRYRASKYVKKKDISNGFSRRKIGLRSGWDANGLSKDDNTGKGAYERGPKEPFHLDFPLADLENTDYHRNFIKSLKRFKGLDESSRILNQGDTPSPYADPSKKELAAKVIEEEQRKRRSRLRRLKASPMFPPIRKRERDYPEDDLSGYGPVRARYGDANPLFGQGGSHFGLRGRPYRDNGLFGSKRSTGRFGGGDWKDLEESRMLDQFDDDDTTTNVKNKRQNTLRLSEYAAESGYEKEYGNEGMPSSYTGKRKSPWARSDLYFTPDKKKFPLKDPPQMSSPLVLVQKNENGQQTMRTFVDGRLKSEDRIDSEDLARLLSRDSNYVVLKKVPDKEQLAKAYEQTIDDGTGSKASVYNEPRAKGKFKYAQLDISKVHHPVSGGEETTLVDPYSAGGLEASAFKESKENIFKSWNPSLLKSEDPIDGKLEGSEERKEMVMSITRSASQHENMEPQKASSEQTPKATYKPPLSEAYMHMTDFGGSAGGVTGAKSSEQRDLFGLGDKQDKQAKSEKVTQGSQQAQAQASFNQEKGLKSYKKEGKEAVAVSPYGSPSGSPYSGMSYKPPSTQEAFQIKLPDSSPKSSANRKYFLYGSDNDMTNTPKHEIKVIQSDFNLPMDNTYSGNNKASSQMKAPQAAGRPYSNDKTQGSQGLNPQPGYGYPKGSSQKSGNADANYYKSEYPKAAAETASTDNFKRMLKKDSPNYEPNELSNNLKRFMRDFQDYKNRNYQTANSDYKSQELPGLSLQELTSHGDKHLQKLNNLLKEIISNKVEVTNTKSRKNVKRGMFQKYKEQKNWQDAGADTTSDPQVRSGKWTSLASDTSNPGNRFDFGDKTREDSSFKDSAKLHSADKNDPRKQDVKYSGAQEKMNSARLNKEDTAARNLYPKREKREAFGPGKDSTKNIEMKVKSTPNVEFDPQPQQQQQQKAQTRRCLDILPEDKLIELLKFFNSEDNEVRRESRRDVEEEAPSRENTVVGRKLLSLSEGDQPAEGLNEKEKKNAECVRKSLQNYLDPLVQKITDFENKSFDTNDKSREERNSNKVKREIELDESMPNDFQNFFVASLGGFSNQKREIVKKDEAIWEGNGASRDESNQIVDGLGNREPSEESTVGKRDTSRSMKRHANYKRNDETKSLGEKIAEGSSPKFNEKKSLMPKAGDSSGDSTNIRIQIVDGGANAAGSKGSTAAVAESKYGGKYGAGRADSLKGGQKAGFEGKGRDSPALHELYVLTTADQKKKFAGPRSDQTPQKQPLAGHLPQVETVYNPSPRSNKAQIEKINSNDGQIKMKYSMEPNVYNGSAAASQNDEFILRNNLRNGNINTFTYQTKDEPTPYPLQSPTNVPVESEFERVDSKSPLKSKTYSSHQLGPKAKDSLSSFTNSNNNPEIIYKEQSSQQYSSITKSGRPSNSAQSLAFATAQNYPGEDFAARERLKAKRYKNGKQSEGGDSIHRDYAEEELGYSEYADSSEEPESVLQQQQQQQQYFSMDPDVADQYLEKAASDRFKLSPGYRNQREYTYSENFIDELPLKGTENLTPEMVQAWKAYASAQLSPSRRHTDSWGSEMQENYYSKNLQGGQSQANFADNKEANINVQQNKQFGENLGNNFDEAGYEHLPSEGALPREKVNARRLIQSKNKKRGGGGPVQIGTRFFYTFKTEMPDEEYYMLPQMQSGKETEYDKMMNRLSDNGQEEKKLENAQIMNAITSWEQSPKMGQSMTDNTRLSSDDSNILENVVGSYIVRKSVTEPKNSDGDWKTLSGASSADSFEEDGEEVPAGGGAGTGAGTGTEGKRSKRSAPESSDDPVKLTEKRLSSGHLTESHYRKYHRKKSNDKRKDDSESGSEEEAKTEAQPKMSNEEEEEEDEEWTRMKRESLDETLKADMLRRMQEEKKVRSMLQNLNEDVSKNEAPLAMAPDESMSLSPEATQTLEDDKQMNQVTQVNQANQGEQNPLKDDQQQHHMKNPSSSPDIYKTFEIKRGRRDENRFAGYHEMKKREVEGEHNIVSRSEPEMYEDTVFLKGKRGRKVKKFSEEGFETLMPDVRFSQQRNAKCHVEMSPEEKLPSSMDGPYKIDLNEDANEFVEPNAISRAAEESQEAPTKDIILVNPPKQKLTHGTSHEAPLLQPSNSLNAPSIFNALRESAAAAAAANPATDKAYDKYSSNSAPGMASVESVANGDPSKNQGTAGAAATAAAAQGSPDASMEFKAKPGKQPMVGAVLLLTNRDNMNKHHSPPQEEYLGEGGGQEKRSARNYMGERCPTWGLGSEGERREDERYGQDVPEENKHSEVEKRSAGEDATEADKLTEDKSELKKSDRPAEIVNDVAGCRCCGGGGHTKTSNNKSSNNIKQSPFPFSKFRNIHMDTRNACENKNGNCGEQILEAILGNVESDPEMKKVIGPGLNRQEKNCDDAKDERQSCCRPPSPSVSIQQVKKLLEKFMCELEQLASVRTSQHTCLKLDAKSCQFLQELVGESCDEPSHNTCHIEPIPPCEQPADKNEIPCPEEDKNSLSAKRNLILKLLEDYKKLTPCEKKKVEPICRYLEEQLAVLNEAMISTTEECKMTKEEECTSTKEEECSTPKEEECSTQKAEECSTAKVNTETERTTTTAECIESQKPTTATARGRASRTPRPIPATAEPHFPILSPPISSSSPETTFSNCSSTSAQCDVTTQGAAELRKTDTLKMPFIWSNPEDTKFLRSEYRKSLPSKPSFYSQIEGYEMPGIEGLAPPRSKDRLYGAGESSSTDETGLVPVINLNYQANELLSDRPGHDSVDVFPKIFLTTPASFRKKPLDVEGSAFAEPWESPPLAIQQQLPGRNEGKQLHKLGYGDAAGLQLSLKQHGPWFSNLDLKRFNPYKLRQWSRHGGPDAVRANSISDASLRKYLPSKASVEAPLISDESDRAYDLDYQDYDYYDYEAPYAHDSPPEYTADQSSA